MIVSRATTTIGRSTAGTLPPRMSNDASWWLVRATSDLVGHATSPEINATSTAAARAGTKDLDRVGRGVHVGGQRSDRVVRPPRAREPSAAARARVRTDFRRAGQRWRCADGSRWRHLRQRARHTGTTRHRPAGRAWGGETAGRLARRHLPVCGRAPARPSSSGPPSAPSSRTRMCIARAARTRAGASLARLLASSSDA